MKPIILILFFSFHPSTNIKGTPILVVNLSLYTMAAKLDDQRLSLVFQSRPDIIKGIKKEAGKQHSFALL